MTSARARLAAVAALALAGCASARPPRGGAPAARGPADAAARVAGQYPAAAAAAQRPWWKRALDGVLGVEGAVEERPAALARPFAVAADQGRVLVADPDGARVLRVDWASGRAEEVRCEGRPWIAPIALATAPGGRVLVADGDRVVAVAASGCAALGAGALERPSGVAVVGDRVYVVDPPRHAVVVLALDGAEVARFGARGDGEGELNFPTAIAAAPDGTLLVVDALNFRVVRFDRDGGWIAAFGEAGDGDGLFARPKAVAVDDAGRVYVSDADRDVVEVFDAAGRFAYAFGGSGSGPGELLLPAGVAVAGGRAFVADSQNGRVQAFDLAGGGT